MRVIAGKAKGRRLKSPRTAKIRPALDKVKGAIFNILYDVTGLNVLDIFAGTGSIGIEALSRGASHATFIDDFGGAVSLIKENLKLCGFTGQAAVIKAGVDSAIKRLARSGASFDLIFVDPPYLKNLVNPTLKLLSGSPLINQNSIIIIEHHPKEPIEEHEGLKVTDCRKYGQTLISFLKPV